MFAEEKQRWLKLSQTVVSSPEIILALSLRGLDFHMQFVAALREMQELINLFKRHWTSLEFLLNEPPLLYGGTNEPGNAHGRLAATAKLVTHKAGDITQATKDAPPELVKLSDELTCLCGVSAELAEAAMLHATSLVSGYWTIWRGQALSPIESKKSTFVLPTTMASASRKK